MSALLTLTPSPREGFTQSLTAAGARGTLRLEASGFRSTSATVRLQSACCGDKLEYLDSRGDPLAAWEVELLGGPTASGVWACGECGERQAWVPQTVATLGDVGSLVLPEPLEVFEAWCAHVTGPFEGRLAALELLDFFEEIEIFQ